MFDICSPTLRTVVFIFKVKPDKVSMRYYKVGQVKSNSGYDHCRKEIRPHHPAETHPAVQDCNDLHVYGHPGREKNDGNKDKQRCKQCCKVGNEIQVIVKDHSLPGSSFLHKIVDLLCKIKYNSYGYDQDKTEEEGTKELPDYININYFDFQRFY